MSNQAYMADPPSVAAGSHEMRDYYINQDPPRPAPHTAPTITPYLGLRARLSQVWINRWTILLLLVLARTLIAISGIKYDLASAQREALSACSSVEAVGSAMASMPHYMSQGVNEMAATGVEKAVHALQETTTLSVTGVEELVVFVINMMTSTYLCLITLAVGGSLHVALQVIEDAQGALNTSIQAIGGDMSKTVGTFETDYDSFVSKLGSGLTSLLGTSVTPPQLNLNASMEALNNLKLPSNLDQGLTTLNKSIPTFAQVNNFTNNAIRFPFEEVKQLINQTMGTYQFDRSVFPVPQKEQLTFCSDNNDINDFFNHLAGLAELAKKIFIIVILLAAVLACIPMAYREIRRWRTMKERSQLVRSGAHDPMDVVYIVSRPYTSTAGIQVANHFDSTRRQLLTRWVIAYATSGPALFVLCLALAGLFSCACQAVLLKTLEKEVPNLTNEVSAFADKIINSLNNASTSWANGVNGEIGKANSDINNNMLGWVNITTGALNDTLNTFVNDTMGVLNTTFGGTVLYQPIVGVLDCLVLLKVTGIQKALTWISDNAHVSFPTLPTDAFTLGAVASIADNSSNPSSSFLSSPGSDASDAVSAAILRLTDKLESGIRTEALIATSILLVYLTLVLFGIIRALTLWYGHDKVRGDGGAAPPTTFGPDGFHDIPLGAVSQRPDTALGPAPKYTPEGFAVVNDSPVHNSREDESYQEQKLGFAGERNIGVTTTRPANPRVSSHADVYGVSCGDVKR